MIEDVELNGFDKKIYASDWRYSAAIVGMLRYFKHYEMEYSFTKDHAGVAYELLYHSNDIIGEEAEKKYLLFAEKIFRKYMHHKVIEDKLEEEFTENQCKIINEKMASIAICKKVFGKTKYTETNKEEILKIIEDNRQTLIKETYANSNIKTMCAKFMNVKKLFTDSDKVCRLNGYYVDLSKKSKSMSYYWNYDTFIANDCREFDFIPFAFTISKDAYFINNNYDLCKLYKVNKELWDIINQDQTQSKNPKKYLFRMIKESLVFLDYEVEVIHKDQEKNYFQTLYVREPAIKIFKEIKERFVLLETTYHIAKQNNLSNSEYYSPLESVVDSILNLVKIDDMIEKMIKYDNEKKALIQVLIFINQQIYSTLYKSSLDAKMLGGDGYMNGKSYKARKTAEEVRDSLKKKNSEKKIKSYQQKLISALTFKDYDKFCTILLQLSSYAEVPFDFAYDLFDDFEQNKNIAYSFVEGLSEEYRKNIEEDKNILNA